jgi:prespore-specific regulator
METQSTKRKNAWSSEEDTLLATTILNHLRSGSLQVKAFAEVSKLINRSSSACAFRWNAVLRKNYEHEIQSTTEDFINTESGPYVNSESLIETNSINHPVQVNLIQTDDYSLGEISTIITSVDTLKNIIEALIKSNKALELKLEQKDHEIIQLKKEVAEQIKNSSEYCEMLNLLQKVKETGILDRIM